MAGCSQRQLAQRAFIKVLLRIAAIYRFVCKVNRDSSEAELNTAFRKVAAKCHPDKGGNEAHSKELHAARDAWKDAGKTSGKTSPTPPSASAPSDGLAVPETGFRYEHIRTFSSHLAPYLGRVPPKSNFNHLSALA